MLPIILFDVEFASRLSFRLFQRLVPRIGQTHAMLVQVEEKEAAVGQLNLYRGGFRQLIVLDDLRTLDVSPIMPGGSCRTLYSSS